MSLPGKEPNALARTPADPGREAEESAAVRAVGFEDVAQVEVPVGLRRDIERAMRKYPETRSASIPALWSVQRKYGWCTPEGIRQAAAVMGVTPAYLESVASFYDLFHLEPIGEHQVLVCTNISCWLRGGDKLLEAFKEAAQRQDPAPRNAPEPGGSAGEAEQPPDGMAKQPPDVSVTGFECLGACDIAPMASIDERYYGPLEPGDAAEAMKALGKRGAEVLPDKRLDDRGAAGGKRNPADTRITKHPLNKPKPEKKKSGVRK